MAAQRPDIIWLNGEKMDMYSNPLEEYWIKKKKKRPPFYKLDICWRGYVATWEVVKDQLILRDIDGTIEERGLFGRRSAKCSLRTFFPKQSAQGIKATWFSGKLRIPRGNMIQFEDSGYDSRFEKELILTVNHGDIIKAITLDYTQRTLVVNY